MDDVHASSRDDPSVRPRTREEELRLAEAIVARTRPEPSVQSTEPRGRRRRRPITTAVRLLPLAFTAIVVYLAFAQPETLMSIAGDRFAPILEPLIGQSTDGLKDAAGVLGR
jgi:hypothetical protein